MTKITRIGAILLALVMCIGMFSACGKKDLTVEDVQKDPVSAIQTGITKYTDGLIQKLGLTKLVNTMETGAVTYDIDATIPDFGKISADIISDGSKKAMSGEITAEASGVSTKANLWIDSANLAIKLPALLGDSTYGVNVSTLENDIKNSIILEAFGIEIDEDAFDLDILNGDKDMWADLKTELGKLTPVITAEALKLSSEGGELTAQKISDAKNSAAEVGAISIEYSLTEDQFVKLCEASNGMIDSSIYVYEDDETDTTVKFKVWLNTSTYAVMAFDINIKNSDEYKTSVILGADPSAALDITIKEEDIIPDFWTTSNETTIKETTVDGKTVITLTTKTDYSYDESMEMEDETYTYGATLTLSADGKYDVKITGENDFESTASGTLTVSDTEMKITVDSAKADGNDVGVSFAIILKTGGTVEAVPSYKNVLTMTEDEFAALSETVGNSALGGMIGEMIGGMMGGGMAGNMENIEDIYGDMDFGDIDIGGDFDDMDMEDVHISIKPGEDGGFIVNGENGEDVHISIIKPGNGGELSGGIAIGGFKGSLEKIEG